MIQKSGASAVAIRARPQPVARPRWSRDSEVWSKVRRERWMYAFILPGFIFFVVFHNQPLSYLSQLISDWKSQGGDQARKEFQQALEKCKA